MEANHRETPVEVLERWEDHGAMWRTVHLSDTKAIVDLARATASRWIGSSRAIPSSSGCCASGPSARPPRWRRQGPRGYPRAVGSAEATAATITIVVADDHAVVR